ncbi:hypothetical protein PsorP6_018060 [Peronosclerospora sorghi]|uniref:Uncharacterized protein n=1 Tax=Peronosclerospora sorghi TaxID=230839 RepID=A0ACC0WEB2_9STRA|nr:hypothetical protein PsorP6_018060 [Peronosclerospora sorghi]
MRASRARHDARFVLPLLLVLCPLPTVRAGNNATTNAVQTSSSSSSIIECIVIPILIVLVLIVAYFVCKRKHSRKRDDYCLPSTTLTHGTSHGDTVFERRVDSAYIGHAQDKNMNRTVSSHAHKGGTRAANHSRRPSQHRTSHRHSKYQSQYEPEETFPPPPPPEMPMLEPQEAQGPGLSMKELQESRVMEQASAEEVERRQTDPAVVARTQEAAEKVLAALQQDPDFEQRWIPYESLLFTRALSKGAFGEVWLAQLENTQVAVKKILDDKRHDVKEIECFGAEIKLMAMLKHPKIVGFLGVSWSDKQDLCAVTEFMAKGDLYGYLERRKGKLNWPDHKIWLAEDIAEALVFLHSLAPKVIHRDLKSKNILLDSDYRAKLSDFGISRKRSVEETMTAGVGTIYWTAPEVLMGKKYTEKADIYSFGIVMSEMDMCAVPYSDKRDSAGKPLQGMKIIQLVIRKGLRPSFLPSCPEPMKALAARCLDADPDARPDASELLEMLRNIQDGMRQSGDDWQE